MWETIREWFFGLGPKYGVNPIIFGTIYIGAIPFFTLSIAWLNRNLRRKKVDRLADVVGVILFRFGLPLPDLTGYLSDRSSLVMTFALQGLAI